MIKALISLLQRVDEALSVPDTKRSAYHSVDEIATEIAGEAIVRRDGTGSLYFRKNNKTIMVKAETVGDERLVRVYVDGELAVTHDEQTMAAVVAAARRAIYGHRTVGRKVVDPDVERAARSISGHVDRMVKDLEGKVDDLFRRAGK